jgi:gamma-glutamyltranspeptidase/glutathione hydrolase
MRRRSFIAAVPLAAAAGLPFTRHNGASAAAAPASSADGPAKFQAQGDIKFDRPDVHAGDRPVGASFASRSAAYGCSGAAGTAHP